PPGPRARSRRPTRPPMSRSCSRSGSSSARRGDASPPTSPTVTSVSTSPGNRLSSETPRVLTADFDYELPESAIAQSPIEPRDSSRLLVTADMSDHVFSELAELLGPDDIVVVNDTRVRSARLHLTKTETGGAVELLLLERLESGNWEALVRPARRLRRGTRLSGEHLEA